jgi:chorismate synthase
VGNSFGNRLRITIFGASHAAEVGVLVEGVPAGVALPIERFMADIDRRRPVRSGETPRREADVSTIEGLDDSGYTTGCVLCISFINSNIRSRDYDHLRRQPRPSHADLVQMRKYGKECDIAGGGMASGRMTVALVAAGVVAKALLPNVEFQTRLIEVGGERDEAKFDDIISRAAADGDSVGGVVECRIKGVREPLGEPFFDSVESVMSHLLFSIPAVKGVEFGDGFEGARKRGSERNDMIISESGETYSNNEGGVNGGIANGNDIVVRVAIKPTPSIAREQMTYNFEEGEVAPLVIGGRHDACIARRAAVVVEAMAAVALADLKLEL